MTDLYDFIAGDCVAGLLTDVLLLCTSGSWTFTSLSDGSRLVDSQLPHATGYRLLL